MEKYYKLWHRLQTPVSLSSRGKLFFLLSFFFLSGATALLYQLMWQRLLYIIFGVDLYSIAIVISVFMFGLGLGGWLGGFLVDKFPQQLLLLYVLCEVVIALFGFASPTLISYLGSHFLSASIWATISGSYCLLALPTLLMGATFPILVAYVYQDVKNVGSTVGLLYFSNTLGGALGAYFGGFILLSTLTVIQILYQAAEINLFIAASVYLLFRKKPWFQRAV